MPKYIKKTALTYCSSQSDLYTLKTHVSPLTINENIMIITISFYLYCEFVIKGEFVLKYISVLHNQQRCRDKIEDIYTKT